MTDVFMPRLSDTMTEGAIAQWLKSEGDTVKRGDVIAEIETDKAVMDLEAYEGGVLEKILVQPGENVAIGAPIAVIGDGSGAGSSDGAGDAAAAPSAEPEAAPAEAADEEAPTGEAAAPAEAAEAGEAPAETAQAKPAETAQTPADESEAPAASGSKIKATPLVRSLARTHGIDLATVTGSGPSGRIVRADIEQLIGSGSKPAAAPAAPTAPEPQAAPAAASAAPVGTPQPDDEVVPMSQIRKVTARRLTEAALVPVFQLTSVVDASRLTEVRRDINTRLADAGVKVSVNDLIVRAVAVALALHPEANASFGGDAILQHKHVNVGVAVALDDGLVVPVVKDADKKSVTAIGAEVKDLATRARAGRLKLDEMSGGTISVSNLGMFGVDQFTAVINPPEAIIVAVGGTADEAVVVDGEVKIRPRTRLTITVDHRVLDGAGAAAFLKDLTDLLTEPLRILV
ncbi:dihydrolipoamide acetyltransferase family protein [Microbacterium horticulturae]|uniref:Dihydrolipoamide acetyltransferase component of pyruvate dehydrogenase complex n=1 Tax=Microbacterium horticulturae TaxID=3028316 RepID=A0ABY8BYV8_9MICO|nr:dihydrolipoamide acetyltransferase family protein [Microbacterium sp. KACC 23027]WEG09401.1 dihydrolipoamide acetyltransferase family protein [Microbacterium sp. KACC 23027]